jgi:hypothetical protein
MPLNITTFPSALLVPATKPASVRTCTCAPREQTPNNTTTTAAMTRIDNALIIVFPVGLCVISIRSGLALVNCQPRRAHQIQTPHRTV